MPLIHSLLHATNFSNPFLRTLVPSVTAAFGIQAAVAIPSIALQSERFYDVSGSLTYLTCTALSLYLPALRGRALASQSGAALPSWPSLLGALRGSPTAGLNWRQVLLSTAVSIWATRLGTFLFSRINSESGRDSRFDAIRGSTPKFFGAFMAQAAWVSCCLMPVLAVNSLPLTAFPAGLGIGLFDIIGVLMYVGGISFEATADRQKSKWMSEKKEKKHSEEFLTRGLWGKSRHPNYFGEVTLWSGIATVAAGCLASPQGLAGVGLGTGVGGFLTSLALAGVSPAFTSFLLFFVSGIPMSEKKYDERFKDNKDYQKWKQEVPMFFPKL